MNALLDLREKLQDTHAAMASMEEALAERPDDDGLAGMMVSLVRRRQSLEDAFLDEANAAQIDICNYRLVKDADIPLTITALADSMKSFQGWLSIVFDAIKNGPKQTSKVSAEVAQQTALEFAYSYPGSLGFVFSIHNDRLLLGETELDQSIDVMFKMVRADSSKELAIFSRAYGVGPIRRMYDWANTHARHMVSADIQWRRKDQVRNEAVVQSAEVSRLCEIIKSTSDVKEEPLVLVGMLVGGDTVTRAFHLRFAEGEDIKGELSDEFRPEGELTLDRMYRATLKKKTTVYYATELEVVSYDLTKLEPVS